VINHWAVRLLPTRSTNRKMYFVTEVQISQFPETLHVRTLTRVSSHFGPPHAAAVEQPDMLNLKGRI